MQLNDLKPHHKNKRAKQVGRGGKRGKTSGKGHKGQKARAGTGMRPAIRDMVKSLPKLRGHASLTRDRSKVAINLARLESRFDNGETVSPQTLQEKGLVKKTDLRKQIKILGNGEIAKKLTVENCTLSKTAAEKIKKSGGTVK